jgi:uncharacterized protein
MEHRIRINMVGAAIVLAAGIALSLITSTAVASRAFDSRYRESRERQQEITVKGSARMPVRSDVAVWRITVKGEDGELPGAFAILDLGQARVVEFLQERGFTEAEVDAGPIATETHYERDAKGNATRVVTQYALERVFTVTTSRVEEVARAAGEVTRFLREGVQVVSARPEFTYSRAGDLRVQILGEATKDARRRADEMARNAGCRVVDVRGVQSGIIQITRPNSTDVSSYGIYDTSTIEKDISVVVTLTLGLAG